MIVVDCTVISDFWIGDSASQEAAQHLWQWDSEWIAPELWRYEFGNVLRTQVRMGRISGDLMNRYLTEGEGVILESVFDINAVEVGKLANSRDLSFYDASYVWLGQVRGLPFYTRDGKLLRKCHGLALPMPLPE